MALLNFHEVSYSNQNKTILHNISFGVDPGDFISIVGASGSGKSTLLKLCCHLVSPVGGRIEYDGKDFLQYSPIELRRRIGYCFQMPYLFGNLVKENMAFPYSIRNLKFSPDRTNELLHSFKLDEEILEKEVKNLSGGEKQRLALVRTLLFKPEILLLDEVTSALDAENTLIVEQVINSLNQEGVTVLWITHNQEQSRKYANRLLTMEHGEIRSLEVVR